MDMISKLRQQRLLREAGYRHSDPEIARPESIHLPDGRTYSTIDLLKNVGRSQSVTVGPLDNKRTKYTLDERRWIFENSLEDVADRYRLGRREASLLKSMTRYRFSELFKNT